MLHFPENKVRRKCGALRWVRSIPGFLRAIFHYENDSYHHLNICDFELPLPCHLAFRIRLQQTHTIWGGKQENCQNKSGGLPGNEVLKAECISYVIESLLPTGNWESLSTFWFFPHFCSSKYVRIPMSFSPSIMYHSICWLESFEQNYYREKEEYWFSIFAFWVRWRFYHMGKFCQFKKFAKRLVKWKLVLVFCKCEFFNLVRSLTGFRTLKLQMLLDWIFQCYRYLDCLVRSKEYANFLVWKSIDSKRVDRCRLE